jgi:hypothetical protein
MTAAGDVSFLRGPLSRRAWRDAVFVAAGSGWLAVFTLATSKQTYRVLALAALLGVFALPWLLRAASVLQRSRFRALLGVELRTVQEGWPSWRGLLAALRTGDGWRQLGYHVVAAPVFAAAGLAMILLWASGFALLLLPGIADGLVDDASPRGIALDTESGDVELGYAVGQ